MTAADLRALKAELGMNAGQLARASGFARTTVRRWLRGERRISPKAERRLFDVAKECRDLARLFGE